MTTDLYQTLDTDRLREELTLAREELESICQLLRTVGESKRRLTQTILALSAELERRGQLLNRRSDRQSPLQAPREGSPPPR